MSKRKKEIGLPVFKAGMNSGTVTVAEVGELKKKLRTMVMY